MNKRRVIKDYDQMPDEILVQLKDRFPHGFQDHLLRFNNAKGELILALPFETDETFYLVRMDTSGSYYFVEEDQESEDLEDDFDRLPNTEELDLDDSEE